MLWHEKSKNFLFSGNGNDAVLQTRKEIASAVDEASIGYTRNRQVFTDDEEIALVDYMLKSAAMYYGMTPHDIRSFAFESAIFYELSIPESWHKNKEAGKYWFTGFMKRHRNISVRQTETTSLSRAMNFNRPNVNLFFKKLADVMERHHFHPEDIWNMDETGATTVMKPTKVVAKKGEKASRFSHQC